MVVLRNPMAKRLASFTGWLRGEPNLVEGLLSERSLSWGDMVAERADEDEDDTMVDNGA